LQVEPLIVPILLKPSKTTCLILSTCRLLSATVGVCDEFAVDVTTVTWHFEHANWYAGAVFDTCAAWTVDAGVLALLTPWQLPQLPVAALPQEGWLYVGDAVPVLWQ